jgi:hypothetical protein
MNLEKIILISLGSFYSLVFLYWFLIYLKLLKRPKINYKRLFLFVLMSFCVFLIGLFVLNKVNFLDYEKPIPYKEFERITFKNFRGYEFFKKEFNGSEYFAYVVTTIEYKVEYDSLYVEAFFHPSKSFVYNKNTNSNSLLSHELYHFKITEYFARKIKSEVFKLKEVNEENIAKIIENNLVEENEFQKKYDSDTYHSYVNFEQIKYEKKTDSLLYLLNNFKTSKIKLNENF